MKIEIEIPKSVVDTLRNETFTDDKIVGAYQKYLAFMLQSDSWDTDGITEFLFWLEHQDINNLKKQNT
jgi:hypothetical protein